MPERKVAVLVGSLRKASYNRKMALALEKLAPAGLKLDIVEIRDLALYDEDLEAGPPQPWLSLRPPAWAWAVPLPEQMSPPAFRRARPIRPGR